jgi:hypothetical protein
VPRKNPLPEADLAVAKRLIVLRGDCQLSREELSEQSLVGVGVISRVELGRMPLRYGDARKLLFGLSLGDFYQYVVNPINPLWLAEGLEPMRLNWPIFLPAAISLKIDLNITFLKFVEANRQLLFDLVTNIAQAEIPESWLLIYSNILSSHQRKTKNISTATAKLEDLFLRSARRLAPVSKIAFDALQEYENDVRPEKKDLLNVSESVNLLSMDQQMPQLLIRLKAVTEDRGAKSELAKWLGVPLASLSQWLAGTREPGGENTLKLLQWVEQHEGKKQ